MADGLPPPARLLACLPFLARHTPSQRCAAPPLGAYRPSKWCRSASTHRVDKSKIKLSILRKGRMVRPTACTVSRFLTWCSSSPRFVPLSTQSRPEPFSCRDPYLLGDTSCRIVKLAPSNGSTMKKASASSPRPKAPICSCTTVRSKAPASRA